MKFRFGPFELDSRARTLRRGDVLLPLGSRALDILVYLANRPGEVIKKKELFDHVWSDVVVEEVVPSAVRLRVQPSLVRQYARAAKRLAKKTLPVQLAKALLALRSVFRRTP